MGCLALSETLKSGVFFHGETQLLGPPSFNGLAYQLFYLAWRKVALENMNVSRIT